jgi:hypothetical protein
MVRFTRCPQTLGEQRNEVHVFALIGAVRIAMLWFSNALESLKSELGQGVVQRLAQDALLVRKPLLVLYGLIILSLYLHLLRGKRVASPILDLIGLLVVISLGVNFFKINLLMLSLVVNPKLLLGQVITFVLFFVLAWGWIFWRFDRVAGSREQKIIEKPGASDDGGSFDYYYFSWLSLLEAKKSKFTGVSRLGKVLVAVHSFMVLDLAAIALARFYQLVQKSI